MNDALTIILASLAALNPAAAALAAGRSVPMNVAASAGGIGAAVLGLGILVAEPMLDALDVSPESFRVAAGIVMIIGAATASLHIWTRLKPGAVGYKEAVHPLGIPAIAGPAALAVGISASANEGIGIALLGAAIAAMAGSATLAMGPRAAFGTVSLFTAALLAVLAVAEIVAGVKSV